MSASDPEFTKHLTCWCSISSPPLNVGQYFSMVPSTSSPGLYSFTLFFLPPSHLSHKLYVHHTWYKTKEKHRLTCSAAY